MNNPSKALARSPRRPWHTTWDVEVPEDDEDGVQGTPETLELKGNQGQALTCVCTSAALAQHPPQRIQAAGAEGDHNEEGPQMVPVNGLALKWSQVAE